MKVFWWQGGVHVEAEDHGEITLLVDLLDALGFKVPPGTPSVPSGHSDSGSDGLFEAAIGGQQVRPCGLSGQPSDKQAVIGIHEAFQIVPNRHRVHGHRLQYPLGVLHLDGPDGNQSSDE